MLFLYGYVAKPGSSASDSALVQKARSEKWMMWTLKNGIGSLPEAWAAHLLKDGVDVRLGETCLRVEFSDPNNVLVHTGKEILTANHVISSVPLFSLSKLLTGQRPDFHKICDSVSYADMALVSLEYKGNVLPREFQGFGFLVPSCESLKLLGMTFDSCIFPEISKSGNTIITAMLGGAWFKRFFGDPSTADVDVLVKIAVTAAKKCLKIQGDPCRIVPKIQEKCIPQYVLHHETFMQSLRRYVKEEGLPLTLVGTLSGGVVLSVLS